MLSIAEGLDGDLWIGTRKGLSRMRRGPFETYTKREGLPSDVVIARYVDREGNVWIGTGAGLCRLRDGKFTTYTTDDGLSSNQVQALYEDREGSLWIGTAGGGLNRFRDGKFKVIDARGSEFHVVLELPVVEESAASQGPPELRGRVVLIVDNSSATRNMLSELVTALQMRPVTPATAELALATLREAAEEGHPLSLILMDSRLGPSRCCS